MDNNIDSDEVAELKRMNKQLRDENDALNSRLDDDDYLLDKLAREHQLVIELNMVRYDAVIERSSNGRYNQRITMTSSELDRRLDQCNKTHQKEIGDIARDYKRLENEIERLTCIVGMLRHTSTVPNAEQIADGKVTT